MKHAGQLTFLVVGLVLFTSAGGFGATGTAVDSGPLGPYPLASVTIEYAERGSLVNRSTVTTIKGDGTGSRVSQLDPKRLESVQLEVEPKQVFELLDLCYRKRFFDLRESYGPTYWPHLRPDGTVEVMSTSTEDAASRSLTVTIGDYSKRVDYTEPGGDPPPVVLEIARSISKLPMRVESK